MLAVAGGRLPQALVAPGIRLVNIGTAVLHSAAPLGYAPVAGEFPLLVTGDAAGLGSLPGLTGLAAHHSWLGLLQTAPLNSWQLGSNRAPPPARAGQADLDERGRFHIQRPVRGARRGARPGPRGAAAAAVRRRRRARGAGRVHRAGGGRAQARPARRRDTAARSGRPVQPVSCIRDRGVGHPLRGRAARRCCRRPRGRGAARERRRCSGRRRAHPQRRDRAGTHRSAGRLAVRHRAARRRAGRPGRKDRGCARPRRRRGGRDRTRDGSAREWLGRRCCWRPSAALPPEW